MVMGRNECGSNAMVTVEEYLEMKSRQETKEVTTKQKNLVYGLEGIKTLFGCSTTTAWRIKNSEWIVSVIPGLAFGWLLILQTLSAFNSRWSSPDTPRVLLFIFSCFAFAILFTGISPSLLTAESFLFNDARKSSNCPMCKCVFVLICKYTNALMCVCVYVLMNVCSCVLMCLYAYVLMCGYINLLMFKYVWVLMC